MKILKITFENINSLKGKWQIDFCHPDFDHHSIFAITGATGSGKTTILDAICLALYGKTPRLETISQASNDLMTVGTSIASSEVVFKIHDKIYRAFWAQKRANKKSDGKLQAIVREISILTDPDNTDDAKILEDRPKEIKKFIENLLGMSMMQFTRSVMLVQGDFAAFLQSKAEDRGEILEQITGTKIYSEIGKAAYEKNKNQQDFLKNLQLKLGEIQLLEQTQFQTMLEQQEQLNLDNINLKLAIDESNRQLNLANEYQNITQQISHWQNMLQQCQTQMNDFLPQKTQLEQAKIAKQIQPKYLQLQQVNQDILNNKQTLDERLAKLPNLQQQYNEMQAQQKELDHKLQGLKNQYEENRELFGKVRQLDHKISLNNQSYQNLQSSLNEQNQLIKNAEHQYTQLQSEQNHVRQNLNLINKENHQHVFDNLTENLNFLNIKKEKIQFHVQKINDQTQSICETKNKLMNNMEQRNKLILEYTEVAQNITSLEKEQSELCDKINKIFNKNYKATSDGQKTNYQQLEESYRKDLTQLHLDLRKANEKNQQYQQIQSLFERLALVQQQINTLKNELSEDQNSITSLTQQRANLQAKSEQAKQLQEQLRKDIELYQQISILKQQLTHLKDDEPCPLCGSTVHPFKEKVMPEHVESEQFEKIKIMLQKADEEVENYLSKINNNEIDSARFESSISIKQNQLQKANEEFNALHANITQACQQISQHQPINQQNILKLINQNTHSISQIENTISQGEVGVLELQNKTHEVQKKYLAKENIFRNGQYHRQQINQELNWLIEVIENAERELDLLEQIFESIKNHLNPSFLIDWQNPDACGLRHALTANLATLKQISANNNLPETIQLPTVGVQKSEFYINKIEELQISIEEQVQRHKHLLDQQAMLERTDLQLQIKIQEVQKQAQQQNDQLQNLQQQIQLNQQHQQTLNTERFDLFADKDVELEESRLLDAIQHHQNAAEQLKQNGFQIHNDLQNVRLGIEHQQKQLEQLQQRQSQYKQQFQEDIDGKFSNEEQFLSALLEESELMHLQNQQDYLEKNLHQAVVCLKDNQQQQENLKLKQSDIDKIDQKILSDKLEQLQEKQAAQHQLLGKISEQLKNEQANRERHSVLLQNIQEQQKDNLVWEKLNLLIGSADGKKYRNFVQGLTLDLVLSHANRILKKMNDRYLLTHDYENIKPLEILVTDLHQGGVIRSSKNLSGGESFMVSLALALGLAQINSKKVQIESLFLDEGFGTLDEDALEMALSTLFELQQNGKSIGIISHVASLKERIDTQIMIEKQAGGTSVLSGAGVSKIY